jgi:heme oxygenase
MERLKLETRAEHEAIEKCIPLMQSEVSLVTYQAYLENSYGFYRPLENQLARIILEQSDPKSYLDTWSNRQKKTPSLNLELITLDRLPDDLPLCQSVPPVDCLADVWGCLYVLEGATLGGQVIYDHLNAVCPDFKTHALKIKLNGGQLFLSPYGTETKKFWILFCSAITHYHAQAESPEVEAIGILSAAKKTFQLLKLWLENERLKNTSQVIS